MLPCDRRISLGKLSEDVWQGVGCDSNAGVFHLHQNCCLAKANFDADRSTRGSEFGRVRNEVAEDLRKSVRVTRNPNWLVHHIHGEIHALLIRYRFVLLEGVSHGLTEVKALGFQPNLSKVNPTGVEEIVHKLSLTICRVSDRVEALNYRLVF